MVSIVNQPRVGLGVVTRCCASVSEKATRRRVIGNAEKCRGSIEVSQALVVGGAIEQLK